MDSPLGLSKTLRDGLKLAATLRPPSQADDDQDLDFFIHPDLAQELAGTLVELAEDAVILSSPASVSDEVLRKTLTQNIQTVIADMYALRCLNGEEARGKKPELSIDGSRFILKLACDVNSMLEKNAIAVEEVVVAGGQGSPFQFPLNMFRPGLSLRMMKWFQRAAEKHANCQHRQDTVVRDSEETRHKGGFDTEHAEIARLREELSVAHDEISRLKQIEDSQDALNCAHAQVRELTEEVSTLTAKVDIQSAQLKRMEHALERSREQCAQARCDLQMEQEKISFAIQELQKYMSLNNESSRKLKELNQQMVQKESEIELLRNLATSRTRSSEVTIRLPPTPSSNKKSTASSTHVLKRNASTMENPDSSQNAAATNIRSSIPPERAAALSGLPIIPVDLSSSNGTPAKFTRQSLKQILGGNATYAWNVKIGKTAQVLSKKYGLKRYLCVSSEKTVWLPEGPGMHGYIQQHVSNMLDRQQHSASDDECEREVAESQDTPSGHEPLHLFAGTGLGNPEAFHYCGMYCLSAAEVLTTEEWGSLPKATRLGWIETVFREDKRQMSRVVIEQQFMSGHRVLFCTRLQCVGFDVDFYKDIVEENRRIAAGIETDSNDSDILLQLKRRRVSVQSGDGATAPGEHDIEDLYA